MGQFKKINAFLVYSICFNETVKDKWCLDKSVGQTENDSERGFVKMAELRLNDWPMFFFCERRFYARAERQSCRNASYAAG